MVKWAMEQKRWSLNRQGDASEYEPSSRSQGRRQRRREVDGVVESGSQSSGCLAMFVPLRSSLESKPGVCDPAASDRRGTRAGVSSLMRVGATVAGI